jgi:hypothetical protein
MWKSLEQGWRKARELSKTPAGLTVRAAVVTVGAALIAKDVVERTKPDAGDKAASQPSSGGR